VNLPPTTARADLEDRRDQALRDLAELRRQVAEGEVDPATADPLTVRYESEAAAVLEALDRLGQEPEPAATGPPRPLRRPAVTLRRRVAGGAVVLVAVAAAALLLPRYLQPRPEGGFVTGNEQAGRDLSEVTDEELEEVVGANPDVVGMRVALARRYFERGEYGKALEHYRKVLDREPHPEALANVGWILFTTTDQTDAAARFVEESLEREPDSPLAAWFLANIRLHGLDDPDGAVEVARPLLASDDLRPDDRQAVRDLLEEARARLSQAGEE
jgi:cytochrome c-type biogenesis protein CcmH/NrfG